MEFNKRFRGVICAATMLLMVVGLSQARTSSSRHSGTRKVSSSTAAKSTAAKSSSHRAVSSKGKKTSRASATTSAKASATKHCKKGKRCSQQPVVARSRGQQVIDSDRTLQIQTALIKANYLDGEPSGQLDQRTRDALTRFQSDNGWQTKVVPDSRALIKLGLGPSREGLLNPESAAVSSPHEVREVREAPGGPASH